MVCRKTEEFDQGVNGLSMKERLGVMEKAKNSGTKSTWSVGAFSNVATGFQRAAGMPELSSNFVPKTPSISEVLSLQRNVKEVVEEAATIRAHEALNTGDFSRAATEFRNAAKAAEAVSDHRNAYLHKVCAEFAERSLPKSTSRQKSSHPVVGSVSPAVKSFGLT